MDDELTFDDRTEVIGFLLVPGFALMSYACAIEPLRAANLLSRRPLYRWRHFSPSGEPARASTGALVPCDAAIGGVPPLDVLLVCAGGNPAAFEHAGTFAWLRRLSARGITIGGVSGGPVILARAGLMQGRQMTVHWEHAPALEEAYPELMLRRSLYVIDSERVTCAGGSAPLDMMHAMIAARLGAAFAARVSDWFLHTSVREPGSAQRAATAHRYGVHRRELVAALELMEHHVGEPFTRAELARRVGLSMRQLDRLFRDHLGTSPMRRYRELRLGRAQDLLRQTARSVTEVAQACGFPGASQLARAYRARFGRSPSDERR